MKKTNEEIKSYYAKGHVVAGYIDRRFSGVGGRYIHDGEVQPMKKIIELLSRKKKNLHVLDVGAGSGRLTREIALPTNKTFALDSSAEMLSELQKSLSLAGVFEQSAFKPIAKKYSFDVITSLRFFEHFSQDDQKLLLQNLLPSLAQKGLVIFASTNALSLESLLSRLFPYGRYNYFYSDVEYTKMFHELGLKVIQRDERFFLPRGVFLYAQRVPGILPILISVDKAIVRLIPGISSYFVYTLQKM